MLTRSTQIPTAVRGKIRALVKAHKHWPVFLRKQGLISASAKNSDLIEFALHYPELTAQIEAIMGLQAPMTQDISSLSINPLVAEIETLLREAGKRAADEYKARRQVARAL